MRSTLSMDEAYSVCRMCLIEMRINEMISMVDFSIKIDSSTCPLTRVYNELTGVMVEGKKETPYVCPPCQNHLKFVFNFLRAVKASDDYLCRINTKILVFERNATENKAGIDQLLTLKAKVYSSTYCRLCFIEEGDFVEVFDKIKRFNGKRLTDIYFGMYKKELESNELSKLICIRCKDCLIRYDNVKALALKHDAYMKQLLEEADRGERKKSGKSRKNGHSNGKSHHHDKDHEPMVIAPEFIKIEPTEFHALEPEECAIVEEPFPLPLEIKEEPEDYPPTPAPMVMPVIPKEEVFDLEM